MSPKSHQPVAARGSLDQDLCVYIGRFQPFHNGHLSVVAKALQTAHQLIILVGSSGRPRDYFNPWSFQERKEMIIQTVLDRLGEDAADRVTILPLYDYTYNNGAWVEAVQTTVANAIPSLGGHDWNPSIALIGHSKDNSSYYLKMFPQWGSIEVGNHESLSATPIREAYFTCEHWQHQGLNETSRVIDALPTAVGRFLNEFHRSEDFANLREEFEHIRTYKQQFAGLKFPPIFQTVDACVIQSGHILLIQRRSAPGKGLWAMPGGFLNADERVEDAVYRELREETKIKVPEPVLRGSTILRRRFDDPHRSARGRTITEAFLIHLPPAVDLPKVKGSDDAKRACWVPLSDVHRDMMFEDHFGIIENLKANL